MKKFLRKHSEGTLFFFAGLFFAIIVGFLYATIQVVVEEVNRAIIFVPADSATTFDLGSAAGVNLRGLNGSSTSAAAAQDLIPIFSAPAPTSTATSSPASSTAPAASGSLPATSSAPGGAQ